MQAIVSVLAWCIAIPLWLLIVGTILAVASFPMWGFLILR